jgi:hypothetical protein
MDLRCPVYFEGRHELGWQRDGAPALVGFQLRELEPPTGSLRAGAGMPGAVRRAVAVVTVLTAGVWVGAAVPPGQALKLPANGPCSNVKVNVLPP